MRYGPITRFVDLYVRAADMHAIVEGAKAHGMHLVFNTPEALAMLCAELTGMASR